MKKLLVFFCISIIAFSCTTKKETSTETSDSIIKVEEVKYSKSTTPIIREEGDTVISTIDVSYIKLSGGNEAVNKKINDYLAEIPLNSLNQYMNIEGDSSIKGYDNIDKAAAAFLAEPEAFKKENPDMMLMGYSYESKIDTLLISPKVITIYVWEYVFTGGAHGNYNTTYLNFDAQTGDLLKVSDFVKDTTALTKFINPIFIANEKTEAKANDIEFDMSMYFFEDGKFVLPSNIGFTKEGLRFTYNPYEVAAYARGQIIFDVPYKDVAVFLNDKYKP